MLARGFAILTLLAAPAEGYAPKYFVSHRGETREPDANSIAGVEAAAERCGLPETTVVREESRPRTFLVPHDPNRRVTITIFPHGMSEEEEKAIRRKADEEARKMQCFVDWMNTHDVTVLYEYPPIIVR
jgi:hypothetical protein